MKRFLFTMMALFALVLFANTTFAQNKMTPEPGSSYTYVVQFPNGTQVGNTVTFAVNESDSIWAAHDAGIAVIDASSAAVVDGGVAAYDSAYVTLTWDDCLADTDVYQIWIKVDDAGTGCSNYRYVPVTITIDFDVDIYAWTASTDSLPAGWDSAVPDDSIDAACPVFAPVTSGSLDLDVDVDDEGQTWLYYVVERLDGADVDWAFSIAWTGSDVTPATVSYYNGTDWGSSGAGYTSALDYTTDRILVRAQIANDGSAAGIDMVATVTATEGTCPTPDSVAGNDVDEMTISAMPDLDNITFN